MERRKTQAERALERVEAIQRLEQQLSGSGERPCSITSDAIPDQIARPKPSMAFVFVGIGIIVFLIVALCISFFSKSKQPKQSPQPEAAEVTEIE